MPAPALSLPPQPNPQPGGEISPGGAAPAPMPPPSHEQTVAALRHFSAVGKELKTLLVNPDLGKSDIKSAIIDGWTKLVEDQIIPPREAVVLLSQVPDRPFDQKQWLQNLFLRNMKAEIVVRDRYRAGNPPMGDLASEIAKYKDSDSSDRHMSVIGGMIGELSP